MSIEIVSTVLTSIFLILFIAGAYYLIKVYPDMLKRKVYAGSVARDRKLTKIETALNEEITTLVINESPEILEMFPKSTELAIETNNVPGWVGMAMGKALPFIAKFLQSSEAVATNPALNTVTSVAQSPEVVQTLLGIFTRVFGNREKGEKKPKQPRKTKLDTIAKTNFPEFT